MPAIVVAVVAAAAGAAATAGAGALLVGAGGAFVTAAGTLSLLGTAAAAIIGGVVAIGVSYAGSSILGVNKAQKAAAANQNTATQAADRRIMFRSSVAPRQVVYGRARVSGPIVYLSSSGENKEHLHIVVPLATHEIDGWDAIWINDTRVAAADVDGSGAVTAGVFAGAARLRVYDGTQTTADSDLVSETGDGWSSDHKGLGVAYLYARLTYGDEIFRSGIPNLSVEVRGKSDVYDPRTDTFGYTENAALCVLDYLLASFGLACDATEIDFPSFQAAANLCDEDVTIDAEDNTQPRYHIGGSFTLDRTPIDVIEDLQQACGGQLVYVQGAYRFYPAAYATPTDTLTASDLAGTLELGTMPSRRELFNGVRGTYIEPAKNWLASDFPPISESAYVTADDEAIWRDVSFPFIHDATRAQRLALIALRRHRESLTLRVPVRYAGIRYCVWQMLSVTLPDLGFSSKAFRVSSWEFDAQSGIVTLSLREEGTASYAWLYDDAYAIGPAPNTDLPSAFALPAPTDLTVTPTTTLQSDGTTLPALLVTWSQAGHPFITGHEVQWRVSPAGSWNSIEVPVRTNRAIIAPVVIGAEYDVRVRAISLVARSAWSSTVDGTGAPDTTAPDAPPWLAAYGTIRAISLTWTMPTAPDVAAIEVWENTSSDTGSRYYIGETKGGGFLRSNLNPLVTRWYWVRSRDYSGNLSAFTSAVSATTSRLVADDIEDGILNTAKFASTIEPVSLVSSVPLVKSTNNIFNTTDNKLYRWTGASYTAAIPAVDVSGELTSSQIADLAIGPAKLAAGAVTTSKLSVGSANQIFNSTCTYDTTGWLLYETMPGACEIGAGLTAGYADWVPADVGGGYVRAILSPGTVLNSSQIMLAAWYPRSDRRGVPVVPGKRYHFSALVGVHSVDGFLSIDWYNSSDVFISASASSVVSTPAGGLWDDSFAALSVVETAPANARWAVCTITGRGRDGFTLAYPDAYVFFTKTMFGEAPANATEAPPWTPGGVTEISGGQVRARTVAADRLVANTITANELAANSVIAGKIAAGAISTTELSAGAVRAVNLASETLITQTAQIGDLTVDTINLKNFAATATYHTKWEGRHGSTDWTYITGLTFSSTVVTSYFVWRGFSFEYGQYETDLGDGNVRTSTTSVDVEVRLSLDPTTYPGWGTNVVNNWGLVWTLAPGTHRVEIYARSQYPYGGSLAVLTSYEMAMLAFKK